MAKEKTSKRRLVLLDTHAIIHRAYHALPEFTSSKGEPTGAIYGLATMLFKIITELKPDYIVACYDLPKKTFRHDAYDNYKAGRAKTDDALVVQIIRSRDFFKALSVPIYECEGFEADDLLGTIAEHLKNNHKDIDVIIA
jgi:DNA polymerase-1